jgi:uncharacterized membrane protein
MTLTLAIALGLHQLATIVWVGGMFFAHLALRPAVKEFVKVPDRLLLMRAVFRRFFPWVWVAILLLWTSGLWVFLAVAQGKAGPHVHTMMGLAAVMTVVFVYIYAIPYRKLKAAIELENWSWAGAKLALIRRLILVNLILGMITALAGSTGRFVLAG